MKELLPFVVFAALIPLAILRKKAGSKGILIAGIIYVLAFIVLLVLESTPLYLYLIFVGIIGYTFYRFVTLIRAKK